jgi:metabolite-proton symporter
MTATTADQAQPLGSPGALRRVVAASMIGTTVEWYDFFLYGTAAALVFPALFFPKSDPLTGQLLSFATYSVGFVARPLGGLVFGHFGDRLGRKRLLILSLLLMGVASILIGFLPTYNQIGVAAPLLLVLLRVGQGFAVGGQWGGAVLIVAEHGEASRRGFLSSLAQAGVAGGSLLAASILALLAAIQPDEQFLAWGWRVPFLLSAILIGIGWWVRANVEESPTFRAIEQEAAAIPKVPVVEAVRRRPGRLLIGAGLKYAENIVFYIVTVFSITYVTQSLGLKRPVILNAILIASAVDFFAIIFFGWLSDRIGRRPVYAFGAFGLAIFAFAFFRLLDTKDFWLMTLAATGGLIAHAAMYGPQAAFLAEMFPTRFRYTAVSVSYQATSIISGSVAPLIATALLKAYGSATPIAIYVSVSCVLTGIAALIARETRGKTFAEIDAEA